ncbi:MAG: nitroreductase family protein [Flavobacteriales bacterium]|nr:nitroreductase family protein [Flavobacteriales bacterium]
MKTEEGTWIPYESPGYTDEEMLARSAAFYEAMDTRRSVRTFSSEPVAIEVIENIIRTASTAPSGAHKQPWTFGVVTNEELKHRIRELAEQEEYENYHGRMSDRWLADLAKFGTDHIKEFIDVAPYLIVVFKQVYGTDEQGEKSNHYYVNESVGIAVGFLLAAIHHAGLVALTHTPSPMNFLEKALDRPANERAFLLIPVGHPAPGTQVPAIERKALGDIMFVR